MSGYCIIVVVEYHRLGMPWSLGFELDESAADGTEYCRKVAERECLNFAT